MAMHPNRAEVAAALHKHMVEHSTHGYTQGANRWGGSKKETVSIFGESHVIGLNDYDCSSSVITAWRSALKGTKAAGKLDSATYTGNMRAVFQAAGFQVWAYNAANLAKAKPGDVLLNDKNHTGMIQNSTQCSEFLIAEDGTIIGKIAGDQRGNESKVRPIGAYGKGWQWILHYPGFADIERKPMVYQMLLRTNVRTGRSLLYKVVNKLEPGMKVVVIDTKTDKLGKVWGHYGRYRWFVISTKRKVRAKRIE